MSEVKKIVPVEAAESIEQPVSVWKKHRFIVSNKVVNYNNLTKFEAASIAAVFVLAVLVGVSSNLS